MYCKKCRKILNKGEMFCANCGTKVENENNIIPENNLNQNITNPTVSNVNNAVNVNQQPTYTPQQPQNKKNKLIIVGVITFLLIIIILISIFCVNNLTLKNHIPIEVKEEEIIYYLKEKYEGEFTNIQLIDEKETSLVAEYSAPTNKPNEFFKYYQVYSTKYDTNFIVVYDKSIGVKGNFFVSSKEAYEKFYDNLMTVYASNEIQEEINNKYLNEGAYNTEVILGESDRYLDRVWYNYNINVSRDFNSEDYNTLVELSQNKNLLSNLKDASFYEIRITFNNIIFGVDSNCVYGIYTYNDSNLYQNENIENEEFIEYMNNRLLKNN